MTHPPPSGDDPSDDDHDYLAPEERDRLNAAHELLAPAGHPPEPLPPLETVHGARLSQRRRLAAAVGAVAAAALLLGLGYLLGRSSSATPTAVRTIELTGRGTATATIAVRARDQAGNSSVELTVSGLPTLPAGQSYRLWLTHDGELARPCGSFNVSGPTTVVTLNAPYELSDFTGWVVTRAADSGAFVLTTETT